jgi:DHA2 family multidrug resistance protein
MTTAVAGLPRVAHAPVNKWLVTISVTFGTLMGAIDASIVNVAVPHIRGAVGATVQEITWISTGFTLATVLVMPLTAFLGRQFGQKRVYMFCLGLFIFGSALCGMAHSLVSLVIFRAIQGFGAGALQPTEQAILRQTFPPKEQGMAMAVFGMAVMIGPTVGPTLGGYIVDHYSWPWIFYINLPVGFLALFMVSRFVHEPEDIRQANAAEAEKQRKNLDWIGIALLSMALVALQYVLEEGGNKDWFQSNLILGLTLFALVTISAFVIRELTAPAPVVDLRLFKDEVFLSGTLVGGVMFAMLMAITFLLPVFMQEVLGFTAMQSGLALMPRSLIMFAVTPFVGKLYGKISARLIVGFGILLFAVSAWQMSHYTLETTSGGVISALLIQGVAFSCLFVPLTTVAMASIPRHKLADAAGTNSLVRQVGGSIGLAIFATMLGRFATTAKSAIGAHVSIGRPEAVTRFGMLTQLMSSKGYDPFSARDAAARMMNYLAAKQSLVLSFEKLFLLAGIAFICVMPLLLLLKEPKSLTNAPAAKVDVHVEM